MKKGFTLIELIVVLLILSVASAWVIPRIAQPLGGVKLKTSAKHILTALRYARNRAVSRNTYIIVHFDLRQNRFILAETDPGDQERQIFGMLNSVGAENGQDGNSRVKILDTYEIPAELSMEPSAAMPLKQEGDHFQVLFYPSGRSTGGKILLSGKSPEKYVVHVDFITGMARLSTAA